MLLLVDGRVGIRESACALLTALGFDCRAAANPTAALRRLRTDSASVSTVICQHALPETDALPFVAALRQRGFRGKIFVYANSLEPTERELWARCRVDRLVLGAGALADILQEFEALALQARALEFPAWTPGQSVRAGVARLGVASL